jgi:hypothetical protein
VGSADDTIALEVETGKKENPKLENKCDQQIVIYLGGGGEKN